MNFDVKKTTKEIIKFIRKYYKDNNVNGAVIGLSGGKDSAVCLALMVKAIGKENVLALWLPIESRKEDRIDAVLLSKQFGIELREFDLSQYASNYLEDLKKTNNLYDNNLVDVSINLKPRLRMLTLYAYAAMMSNVKKKTYLVIGTSNKSERFVGYFTKGGDGVFDIAPVADLYVDEVIKIGDYLKVPQKITHKTPDDGLSGIPDEEKLGFTYSDVKKVSEELETGIKDDSIDPKIRNRILKMHEANYHKFCTSMYKRNK